MTAPINQFVSPADMRDIRAVREVLDKAVLVGDLREQNAALFRAEFRAFMMRSETALEVASRDRDTMLKYLRKLVDVPRDTVDPPATSWTDRARQLLDRPATNRAVMLVAVAGILASLASCAYPVAHLVGALP